jgi:thiol-disulfide isomerase/thioredoxin
MRNGTIRQSTSYIRAALLVTVASVALSATAGQSDAPLGAGAAAPNYTFKNAKDGKFVSLHGFKGKYKAIVMDFFASWCGPCQKLIPNVIEMHKKYKNKGVLVIGVDVWDKWDDMTRNIADAKIPYLVLHDAKQKGGVSDLYNVKGIPTLFIVDGKTMTVKGSWVGYPRNEAQRKREELAVLASLGVK